MFKKVLIANRGEIAIRITRACREMGIQSVAVFSDADRDSLHVFLADEAYNIGPAPSKESYLNYEKILEVAKSQCGCCSSGLWFFIWKYSLCSCMPSGRDCFYWPTPENIEAMGDKLSAKALMKKLYMPTVPGSDGSVETVEDALAVVRKIGLPVIIKASAGAEEKRVRCACWKRIRKRLSCLPQRRLELFCR